MKRTIKLENGFTCTIDDVVLDDMELVDLIAESEENPLKISGVVSKIFGDSDKKALYDHLRTKDGRVPITDINTAIEQVFNAMGDESKN